MPLPSQPDHSRPGLAYPFPRGCKEEQGKRLFERSQSDSPRLAWTGRSPAPAQSGQLALRAASALPSLPAFSLDADCWVVTPCLLPRERKRDFGFASTDILRKAHAFLGGILFLVRKLEALKMSAPSFSTLDPIGVSFSFPFVFLGT